ncbi:hypothetical protein J8273_5716 [Carpediemonas membranifera]|uniref:Autophagy protein ATG17-like domain-containing protein n=1 Tax=Carpediemonas membranifera TaxID=201153 RepID=A0A8J6DYY8_9EUKA|nr:hypothetical protein J8273_5716 [Carpediemonas membranifera]|eukprot:KAG9392904.1 hypothetical protein J8273_5716 [Carpediemonas membranifera]
MTVVSVIAYDGTVEKITVDSNDSVGAVKEQFAMIRGISSPGILFLLDERTNELMEDIRPLSDFMQATEDATVFAYDRTVLYPDAPVPVLTIPVYTAETAPSMPPETEVPASMDDELTRALSVIVSFDQSLRQTLVVVRAFRAGLDAAYRTVSGALDRLNNQSAAIECARANMELYQRALTRAAENFTASFTAQRQRHEAILANHGAAIERLRATPLDPAHQAGERETLADLVDLTRVETWEKECRVKQQRLTERVEAFSASFTSRKTRALERLAPWRPVSTASLTDQARILEGSVRALDDVSTGIEAEIEQLQHLVQEQTSPEALFEATPALSSAVRKWKDALQRQWSIWGQDQTASASVTSSDVAHVEIGRETVEESRAAVGTQMKQAMAALKDISVRQTEVSSLQRTVTAFANITRKYGDAFEPLAALETLPEAYPRLLTENRRRDSWNRSYMALLDTAGRLVAAVHSAEQHRRDAFQEELTGPVQALLGKLAPSLTESLPLPQVGIAPLPSNGTVGAPTGPDPVVADLVAALESLIGRISR